VLIDTVEEVFRQFLVRHTRLLAESSSVFREFAFEYFIKVKAVR
jgi:hypothetical protein